MGRFVPDPRARLVIQDAVLEGRVDVAAEIVEGTRRNALDHRYAQSVHVDVDLNDDTVRVTTDYPFAHLDESGSANNPPTAAMRRAAEAAGRFVSE